MTLLIAIAFALVARAKAQKTTLLERAVLELTQAFQQEGRASCDIILLSDKGKSLPHYEKFHSMEM